MRLNYRRGAALVATLLLAALPICADELNHGAVNAQLTGEEWWDIPYPTRFDPERLSRPQPSLVVSGRNIVDEDGEVVVLRGVNVADPAKLAMQGRWNRALFEEVADWGANVVRLPVHPLGWRRRGPDWYMERIDESVEWANALGMYLILDWHSIGNLNDAMYQHPMYDTDLVETRDFWRRMAFRYRDVPTVAVYELFNEPTDNFIGNGAGSLGRLDWDSWRDTLEELTDIVQVYDPQSIVLVGGLNWAYDLSPVSERPLRREGVAYASHAYPQKARPETGTEEGYREVWTRDWGFVADSYPVIATEIGWVREDGYNAHVPVIDNDGDYGPNLVNYMSERGISWTVWSFDVDWGPRMISDWDYTPTEQGRFFREVMRHAQSGTLSPAVVPSPRVAEYPWMSMSRWRELHAEDVAVAESGEVNLLFVGDSITEDWPAALWDEYFAPHGAANFGIGGDMTENLLWRLRNGAAGRIDPRAVVLMIGSNNLGIRGDAPADVANGVEAVVDELQSVFPEAHIVLLGILPRDPGPGTPLRDAIAQTNADISALALRDNVSWHDLGGAFLDENGMLPAELMADYLHPTESGYALLAERLDAILEPLLN